MKEKIFIICVLITANLSSQTYIDKYLTDTLTFTTIGTSANLVSIPTDLDFKPHSNQLWVVNRSTEAQGGTTVIFENAGLPNQSSVYKKDANSWHFMSLPSAIAIGDNERFANSADVKDANHGSSTFTGPSLWSTDLRVYAKVDIPGVAAYNGSHLDMLHQSPHTMGIAHDSANIYWVFDGWNNDVVRYDFGKDHGPGRDDHNDGKVHRYKEVVLTRLANTPSHMVIDKNTGWLYICEPANSRILRMNTKTGNKKQNLAAFHSEPLVENWEMENVVWEVYIDTLLTTPVGIDFVDDRLLVSDNSNGEIIIYNTSGSNPVEMGRINTGAAGIMGIKVGTDGRIWYVNHTQNTVVRIDHAPVNTDAAILEIKSPTDPYFCGSSISSSVVLLNNGSDTLKNVTINYSIGTSTLSTYNWSGVLLSGDTTSISLPAIPASSGYQILSVYTSNPNGSSDENTLNDKKVFFTTISALVSNLPFDEGFEGTQFPPAEWQYNSPADWSLSNSVPTINRWTRVTSASGFGNSSACARMDNFSGSSNISGQVDDLISPLIDFSTATVSPKLAFNVAYARFGASTCDSLSVSISTDCGNSWTKIYGRCGSSLATSIDKTTSFTPNSTEWRQEIIDLSAYIGQANLKVKFHSRSANGNNLFIDDIKIENNSTLSIADEDANNLVRLFPNPSSGEVFLKIGSNMYSNLEVRIYDLLGAMVGTPYTSSRNDEVHLISSPELQTGVYLVNILLDGELTVKKLVISK